MSKTNKAVEVVIVVVLLLLSMVREISINGIPEKKGVSYDASLVEKIVYYDYSTDESIELFTKKKNEEVAKLKREEIILSNELRSNRERQDYLESFIQGATSSPERNLNE